MTTHYQSPSTKFRIQSVKEGRETIASLMSAKARYEGGSAILTEAITEHADHPLGKLIKEYYAGICEALDILQRQEQP